jgi:hypothetical protein
MSRTPNRAASWKETFAAVFTKKENGRRTSRFGRRGVKEKTRAGLEVPGPPAGLDDDPLRGFDVRRVFANDFAEIPFESAPCPFWRSLICLARPGEVSRRFAANGLGSFSVLFQTLSRTYPTLPSGKSSPGHEIVSGLSCRALSAGGGVVKRENA